MAENYVRKVLEGARSIEEALKAYTPKTQKYEDLMKKEIQGRFSNILYNFSKISEKDVPAEEKIGMIYRILTNITEKSPFENIKTLDDIADVRFSGYAKGVKKGILGELTELYNYAKTMDDNDADIPSGKIYNAFLDYIKKEYKDVIGEDKSSEENAKRLMASIIKEEKADGRFSRLKQILFMDYIQKNKENLAGALYAASFKAGIENMKPEERMAFGSLIGKSLEEYLKR